MILKNEIYYGADGRQSLVDLIIPDQWNKQTIVFLHGYMGFKDWGCWNLVEVFFVQAGYAFCKYNVSHNGCTLDHPIDFKDENAFGRNNYTKELQDFEAVLTWLKEKDSRIDKVNLIGHSRGGGVAFLASKNPKIESIVSWAAISNIENRFPKDEALQLWKKDGVRYQYNGRTMQNLPLYYSQFEDFIQNKEKLNLKANVEAINKPLCIIHGESDSSVHISEGEKIAKWAKIELHIIPNTQHTFDSSHPWKADKMPDNMEKVCKIALNFFEGI
jgi:pimeloyl-ACP methyl ester carboxylesterase